MDEFRLEKVKKLKALGINPYPYSYVQKEHAAEIVSDFKSFEGKSVSVAGRIIRARELGKLYFLDLIDGSGKIQILARADVTSKESMDILGLLDAGDIIGVSGKVIRTKRGETSVEAEKITMLAKSLMTLPEKFHGLSDIELRYRKRYLDLVMNPEVREVFRKRARIIEFIRQFLIGRGYLEVETPILQQNYGGATAKPFVTHHNFLDTDMYLRIADELYLKRLIIGGLEKVFEFSKDFRNESVDANHNPEFTMLEFYEAYADYDAFMELIEKLLSSLVKELHGSYEFEYQGTTLGFTPPFKRIKLVDAIKEASNIDISLLTDAKAKEIAAKEKLDIPIKNAYHVADALFSKYIEPNISNPAFVIDYPSYMCPLTKDKRGNEKLSERFELFIAGRELANSYSELTDPVEQRTKFEEQDNERKKGDQEAPPSDEDFLEAISYGMPPTAGIGIGIDRLVALLTNSASLKEVILFPSVKPEQKKQKKE